MLVGIRVAVPFWQVAPSSMVALEFVKRASASCGPLFCTVTPNPSAGTALSSTTELPWHVTVMEPPAFEKVVTAAPGVTDVAVIVVVVVVCPSGAVEAAGSVVVVVVVGRAVRFRCVAGNVVVVGIAAGRPPATEVDDVVDSPVGGVFEIPVDVLGTLQVVIDPALAGEAPAAPWTGGAGMTGSGGEAIALVTVPTPTQLTPMAAVVATTHAAIGSGFTRRMQRFSQPKQPVDAKTTIIPGLTRVDQRRSKSWPARVTHSHPMSSPCCGSRKEA